MERFETAVKAKEANGFMVFTELDHAAAAKKFSLGRGRPIKQNRFERAGRIGSMVRQALRENNNQMEAAVAHVVKKARRSRSSIFADLSGPKRAKKRKPM